MLSAIIILPLIMSVLGLFRQLAHWLPRIAAGLMIAQIPVVVWACAPALRRVAPPAGSGFAADGVSAAFAILTTIVAAAAMLQAAFLLPAERREGHDISDSRFCLFYAWSGLFVLAMYGVLMARNLGYMWIAMEMTTLMSAPLVFFHRSRLSLEATWKYLLLCSVGIAFALFGTVLIFASSQSDGNPNGTLVIGELLARGKHLDPRLLRLGFIFCLLGYGTKAGLFPLHNWLPDAHSEAPAPASAMLSGALLNCALVALWRITGVVTGAGLSSLVQHTLVPMAAITVFAAGMMLVRQHDLKRMWAYSSVEHMGLLALAIGIGSGPVFVLHAINHSIVKVALFLLAGNILHLYGTKSLGKLTGLLRIAPMWGVLLAAGSFAIAGSPPFGTFLSEWLLLRDIFASGHFVVGGLVIAGLTITFIAIACHVGRILFGNAPEGKKYNYPRSWYFVPAALLLVALATGLVLAPRVMSALTGLVARSVL
ncbi:MAG: proton-conducting transporter transmembrane domain-containing protein [Armatimonadota bacterium]